MDGNTGSLLPVSRLITTMVAAGTAFATSGLSSSLKTFVLVAWIVTTSIRSGRLAPRRRPSASAVDREAS